jgi:hypothetical protein
MLTKEEAYSNFESGWYKFIDTIYTAAEVLPFTVTVLYMQRRFGMLTVKFNTENLTDIQRYILECIEYKIERESVSICEVCGIHGRRRKELTPPQTLCTEHYALRYSDIFSTPSLTVSHEPHTDY